MRVGALGAGALFAAAVVAVGWGQDQRVESARQALWEGEGARPGQGVTLLMELPPQVRESSGLVVSRVNPGLFWTHNDSGGEPVLYALWPELDQVRTLRLEGAPARDWEDMDEGPCPDGGEERCLYVGDIGDNLGRRRDVGVVFVREPRMTSDGGESFTAAWQVARLRYPDGPRDAEALIVSENGRLRIVTKGWEGEHGIYGLPLSALTGTTERPTELTYEGRLPLAPVAWLGRVVTAGADAPDGIAVRTYTEVHFFREESGSWVRAAPPCVVASLPPTGEGLDVDPDGTVFLSSEATRSQPGALQSAECPPG
ncbi:MAG: hypothetical protein HKO53_20035 [Gemmatimonadetes bacterium]|nr:hypothetical protein [Gemmatimonadota bacterium]